MERNETGAPHEATCIGKEFTCFTGDGGEEVKAEEEHDLAWALRGEGAASHGIMLESEWGRNMLKQRRSGDENDTRMGWIPVGSLS